MREARARVRERVMFRDAGINVDPSDGREIEVVASGLPFAQGIPLAIDATMASPLRTDGAPHPGAETRRGAALQLGRGSKARTYPELVGYTCSSLRLLTAGMETGGRLDPKALVLSETHRSLVLGTKPLHSEQMSPKLLGPGGSRWCRWFCRMLS